MPARGSRQPALRLVQPHTARWDVADRAGEVVKLDRSLTGELVRAERSPVRVYAYIEKSPVSSVGIADPSVNRDQMHVSSFEERSIGRLPFDEFRRKHTVMQSLTFQPGQKRGYWKLYPKKAYRQAVIHAGINDLRAKVLMDTGANASIIDPTFAREVGAEIDTSEWVDCAGVGGSPYQIEGKARIKITLAGNLVYFHSLWVGKLENTSAILDMDFMEPAGVRVDTGNGTVGLPDGVYIPCEGRRPLFSSRMERDVTVGRMIAVDPGGSMTVDLRKWSNQKLWIRREKTWVPTVITSVSGHPTAIEITNIADRPIQLTPDTKIAMWLSGKNLPRAAGYVSMGSRRYEEWQTLAFESTSDPIIAERRDREIAKMWANQPPAVE